mgnify:CR=1 FL=1
MSKSNANVSRGLSKLLRHAAIEDRIAISKKGWVNTVDAIRWLKTNRGISCNETDIRNVVETDQKQRYSLQKSDTQLFIRANQGHSMPGIVVDMKVLACEDVNFVVHGTYYQAWEHIKTKGLSIMGRHHVHFARELPHENCVISGMRSSCQVLIWIDVCKAMTAGMKFFESDNGVILTAGFNGIVSPNFFHEVRDRKTGKVIWTPDETR